MGTIMAVAALVRKVCYQLCQGFKLYQCVRLKYTYKYVLLYKIVVEEATDI